jgi:hypothetical protein
MEYTELLSKLPKHTELHYLSDADPEYQSAKHDYILFSYTTDMPETLSALKSNNIDYTIKTDSFDLDYILI